MTTLDDFYIDQLNGDIQAIINDPELDDDEKIVALMELPDPTMDEEKAERILLENKKKQKRAS